MGLSLPLQRCCFGAPCELPRKLAAVALMIFVSTGCGSDRNPQPSAGDAAIDHGLLDLAEVNNPVADAATDGGPGWVDMGRWEYQDMITEGDCRLGVDCTSFEYFYNAENAVCMEVPEQGGSHQCSECLSDQDCPEKYICYRWLVCIPRS